MIILEQIKTVIFFAPVISDRNMRRILNLDNNEVLDENVFRLENDYLFVLPSETDKVNDAISVIDALDTRENGWTWVLALDMDENVLEEQYNAYIADLEYDTHSDVIDYIKLQNGNLVDEIVNLKKLNLWLEQKGIVVDNRGENINDWWWEKPGRLRPGK